jgi:hypothetical protein
MSLSLNEDQEALLRAQEAITAEKESLRLDGRTLSNLRAEHARLKDDFRYSIDIIEYKYMTF